MEQERFSLNCLELISDLNDNQMEVYLNAFVQAYDDTSAVMNQIVQEIFNGNISVLLDNHISENVYGAYFAAYRDYINAFYNEFIVKHQIKFNNVDFGIFLRKALTLGNYRPNYNAYKRTVALMQYVSVTSQVLEFLIQIKNAVTHRSAAFKYMEIGAEILRYTDNKMFRKMYNSMNKINSSTVANNIIDAALRNDVLLRVHHYPYYGKRAAMADYSYSFKTKYTPQIHIAPVGLDGNMLKTEYNENDCSLKFGLGLQAALFETPIEPGDIVLSFAGTQLFGGRTANNVFTDLCQIMHGPETTYLAAVGILNEVTKIAKDQIIVVGHSLGGGLMQYSCTAIDDARISGTGFNSAGLSSYSCYTLTGARISKSRDRIMHICAKTDPISKVGKQLGVVEQIDTGKIVSHSLNDLNERLNKRKISCYI